MNLVSLKTDHTTRSLWYVHSQCQFCEVFPLNAALRIHCPNVNVVQLTLQQNGLSPVWVSVWFCRWWLCVKPLLQMSHTNRLSPVCIRICRRRDWLWNATTRVVSTWTHLARVRPLPGVHALVVLQLVLGVERHRTSPALEWFVTRMYAQVSVQIATLKYNFCLFLNAHKSGCTH